MVDKRYFLWSTIRDIPKTVALRLIWFYQMAISPHLSVSCRYYPTCSAYTYQSVNKYGVIKGGIMGIKRILRCHPLHPGGYDPVQ